MFKKILLLVLIFSLFLFSFKSVDAGLFCLRTQANLNWPASPLGTEITEPFSSLVCREGYYFKENVNTSVLIQYFYEWMIVLGGLVAFIAFIWAGILYMTSVGDSNKMSEAKKKIRNALLGLVLLLSSYLIFNTINPELTALGGPGVQNVRISDDFSPHVQDKLNSFIKTYVQCVSAAEMRERGEITIPVPLLRVTHNPFPKLDESRIDPIYRSFLPGNFIRDCQQFKDMITNQRTVFFPRIDRDVMCVLAPDRITWIPPGSPFSVDDPSQPTATPCVMGYEGKQTRISRYLVIGGERMRNYEDLIRRLNLPPFPHALVAPTSPAPPVAPVVPGDRD